MTDALHARGKRREWADLPAWILATIEAFLGDQVVAARSMTGGFSPGIAARVTTSSGRRVFVKAVSAETNADAAIMSRREIRIASGLNSIADLPVPRLLWSYEATDDPWVALMFDCIEGDQPAQPWHEPELSAVVAAMDRFAATLTPSPIQPPQVAHVRDDGLVTRNRWRDRLAHPNPGLDDWSARNLPRLADLCDRAPASVEGTTLLHGDLRADNMLISTAGDVYFVDWPHAGIGPSWLDPMAMAPSVEMHGGPKAADFFAQFASARTADADMVTIALAAIAGYFINGALEPEIPALPGLRAFQAAQGNCARPWLQDLLGWS